jgi:hypothetical protein
MTGVFDPAAWVAEYEALGGHVSVVHWGGEKEGLWLGLTYPRDPEGRGNQMLRELYNQSGDSPRARAVLDYVAATRGVFDGRG